VGTVLLLLAFLQGRAGDQFSRVTFDHPEASTDEERKVLEVLLRREAWLEAFHAVEERAGRFPEGLSIRVGFDWKGDEYAHGGSGPSGGWIRFNLKKLGEYQKVIDELESRRVAEEKKGRHFAFSVPPARMDRMIWHELTHVLQAGLESPEWFKEGMAVWVSDDPNCLASFARTAKKVEGIETVLDERGDVYARGHLFFKWLEGRGVTRKVIDATLVTRKPWKASLEEATGLSWEAIQASELEGSRKELEKIRSGGK
jgi:hypothetical protein